MLERALRLNNIRAVFALQHVVRKHTMLERALRQESGTIRVFYRIHRQKAYNAREGIETSQNQRTKPNRQDGQKAYNAREGIETDSQCTRCTASRSCVRKHTMLERALRPAKAALAITLSAFCQKAYNAREGIETPTQPRTPKSPARVRQKAYNAREGIETLGRFRPIYFLEIGQKAYNAREGIETNNFIAADIGAHFSSESIQCSRGH